MELEKVGEGVYVIPEFMTDKECDDWIRFSEGKGYEIAKINMGFGTQVINKSIRNNERYIHDSVDLAEEIWLRLKDHVIKETDYGVAIGLNERFRFYRYYPGQQFRPHKDGSYMRNIHEWSSYTFMIYLNEEMKGGATKFPDCSIQPKKGTALIFKHEITHEGCPIIEGVKYVLRTDIMYKRKTSF